MINRMKTRQWHQDSRIYSRKRILFYKSSFMRMPSLLPLPAFLSYSPVFFEEEVFLIYNAGIDVFYPIPWLDSVGSFIIGGIEMYVGYHLADENVPTLIGEGVDNKTYEEIIKTIKENPYVTEVKNVKTILIGPSKFKVVAEITYELDVNMKRN